MLQGSIGRRPRSLVGSALAALAALATISACSSSKTSSSSNSTSSATTAASSGTTAPATGATPSGSPVILGNIGNFSNAQLGVQPDDEATPKAWVAWANANGGINGHPVKLVQVDDAGDPARAVAGAHTLVADHVLAVVGNSDIGAELAYVSYLEQNNTPMVGGDDYDNIWELNANLFPTMATVSVKGYADVYAAKFAGAKTVAAAYCQEVAACLQDVQAQKAAAPGLGVNYVIGPKGSFVQPDYTAQCTVLASSHAEAYYFSSGVPGIEHMASDCQRQGFTGFWILPQPDDSLLKAPGISKFAIGQDLQLSYFADVPATQTFRQGMAKYAPGVPLQIDSLRIWSSFDATKQALENVPNEPLTPQAVKDGLYKFNGYTDNGILPPLTYVKGQGTVIRCFELWGIKGGQFTLPQGTTMVCAPKS